MPLTLPYPTYSAFTPTTVHNDTAHNVPHAGLLSNDAAIKSYLDNTIEPAMTALQATILAIPQGRIVSTALSVGSGGTYPVSGQAKDYTYNYTGAYVPLFITARFALYGGGSAIVRIQYRWLNASSSAMSSYIDVVALNPMAAGDGGAGLNDTWQATIPFIVGAKYIQMQDLLYSTRTQFAVQTITEHQISRWAEWGY